MSNEYICFTTNSNEGDYINLHFILKNDPIVEFIDKYLNEQYVDNCSRIEYTGSLTKKKGKFVIFTNEDIYSIKKLVCNTNTLDNFSVFTCTGFVCYEYIKELYESQEADWFNKIQEILMEC